MKKLILFFACLFTFSTALVSCRDNPEGTDEVELNDEDTLGDEEMEVPREEGVGEIKEGSLDE
ncbi:hypothetical protein [Salinimicrobium sp. GXAS 041]|uniref:hypothetical protein n=1 Tax=Salinimicrobium sp. GXAS 041 TaxID=3400806 RepID=UPI003C727F08